MIDRPVGDEHASNTAEEGADARRRPWSAPQLRVLKTSAAENGPNFNAFDGIEGHS